MRRILRTLGGLLVAGLTLPPGTSAQTTAAAPPTEPANKLGVVEWCNDATTICWNTTGRKYAFTGLRFVFEPQLGVLIQNGDNKFDNTNFKSLEKIGLATNLAGRWVGLQALFIYPSSIQFDEQSPLRVNNELAADTGKVDVEWGGTVGFTFLDGILSLGMGYLHYDKRDFKASATRQKSDARDSFIYFNVQAVETIKTAVKQLNAARRARQP